ncbi:MAG: protein kinase [Candidatus Riflebacteria bacterium]|nr:protein kinase [Candidatus Riflebacteria bacterium]
MADYCDKRAGNYTILRKIGDGGFATVYLAQHSVLEKKAAVKFLLEDWVDEADVVARFFDEARTMERLHDNPQIIKIIDIATVEKCAEEGLPPYFIMEYVDGRSLEEFVKSDESFTLEDIIKIMTCALSALQHCHNLGVVHRDVKPGNFMITKSGDVKLTDFGIAKATINTSKTGEGLTLGSTDYMSPEQALGKRDLDYRSDIYSLGVSLYQMVCDRLPFIGDSPNGVALMHIQEKPVPPVELIPDIPMRLNDIIVKAMAKEREHRFQSCDEMLEELQKLDQPYVPSVEMAAVDITGMHDELVEDHITGLYSSSESGATTRKAAIKPPVALINMIRIVLIFIGFTIVFLMVFKGLNYMTRTHLVVNTYPQGAMISLNKDLIGSSPVDLYLQPMGYLINLSLPGYATASYYYNLAARQTLELNRKMFQLNPPALREFTKQMAQLGAIIAKMPGEPPKNHRDLPIYEEQLAGVEKAWEELYEKLRTNSDDERFNRDFIAFCLKYADLKKAESFYDRLVGEKPSAMAYAFAGNIRMRQRNPKDALRLYMEAWTRDQNNIFLLNALGDFFIADKKAAQAKQYLEMSLFLYPEQDEIRKKLAEMN